MIERVKKSFHEGVKTVRWFATFLADRTKAEASMARLLYESKKLEARLNGLYGEIGKRVMELKDKEEKDVFKDSIILQTVSEITKLQEEIEDYKKRAHEHGKPPDITDQPS